MGKDNMKYLALAATAIGVPWVAGAFAPAAVVPAEALGTSLVSGIPTGAATKAGAQAVVQSATAEAVKAGGVKAAEAGVVEAAKQVGASAFDRILGYGAQAATLAGGAAALRKPPSPPRVPRVAPPRYAADSADAARRRRMQALAAYGPMGTIKTGPLGIGGGPSTLGGGS